MATSLLAGLFNLDPLAGLMTGLVSFIALVVASFASRYMKGDRQYGAFVRHLIGLVASVIVMVCADHLLLLFVAWALSNWALVRLMIHKPNWDAAKRSGQLAAKNYVFGLACMALAFGLMYWATGLTSIRALIHHPASDPLLLIALVLLLLSACSQSAIWPFHRWLISSLNSPTPVSARMHAGLVNGGGFLLARFAPLFGHQAALLTGIFVIGLTTALIGTFWKLMQNDVKRMLACSTLGQMGFMMVQCGLGLFPAAVAHLCWHGLFKAYLFLASGGAAQEKRLDLHYPPSLKTFACACLCGLPGAFSFMSTSGKAWVFRDTNFILIVMAYIAATQLALPILRERAFMKLPLAGLATLIMGSLYGFSVHLIEAVLAPLSLSQPQPLNPIHILGLMTLALGWLGLLFLRLKDRSRTVPPWGLGLYVYALNASQPHPSTVTAHHNHYQYR